MPSESFGGTIVNLSLPVHKVGSVSLTISVGVRSPAYGKGSIPESKIFFVDVSVTCEVRPYCGDILQERGTQHRIDLAQIKLKRRSPWAHQIGDTVGSMS